MARHETHDARSKEGKNRPSQRGARLVDLIPYLRIHKLAITVAFMLSILGAGVSLLQPIIVGRVISEAQSGGQILQFAWWLVALVVLAAIIGSFQQYVLQRTGESVVLDARRRIVSSILKLPIPVLDQLRRGDLISRAGTDTNLLRNVLTQGLVEILGGTIQFLVAIIAMVVIDPLLFVITAVIALVSIVSAVLLAGRIRGASRQAQQSVGDLSSSLDRAISAVRTIRAANATEREICRIEKSARYAWIAGNRVAKVQALIVPVSGISSQVAILAVLGVGGFRVTHALMTISELIMFVLFLFIMVVPLGKFFSTFASINQALGALARIHEVTSKPLEEDLIADSDTLSSRPDSSDGYALVFNRVSFSYATKTQVESTDNDGDRKKFVLRNVSFKIPRGSRTALVGASGAGKSTIFALIERFNEVDFGSIHYHGRPLKSISFESLRETIGYVEQDAPALAGTFRENLLIGAPDASDSDCLQVLDKVNLSSLVNRNPAGLNAEIGDNGVLLSGGERQRLALARVLLSQPSLLLLDESTSSLDRVNELVLQRAIDAVAPGRTLITIAHRLSTVIDSDQIIVLNEGTIVGTGTHAELLETNEYYRQLAAQQLAGTTLDMRE